MKEGRQLWSDSAGGGQTYGWKSEALVGMQQIAATMVVAVAVTVAVLVAVTCVRAAAYEERVDSDSYATETHLNIRPDGCVR